MVAHFTLRTNDENKVFFRKKNRIWRLFRCNQIPSTNRNAWFTPCVRIVKWATIKYKNHDNIWYVLLWTMEWKLLKNVCSCVCSFGRWTCKVGYWIFVGCNIGVRFCRVTERTPLCSIEAENHANIINFLFHKKNILIELNFSEQRLQLPFW